MPPGVVVEDPFEIVYAIDGPGRRAVRAHARDRRRPTSEFRVHEYDLAEDFPTGQALHAGAFELLPAGRRALSPRAGPGLGPGEVYDVSTRFVGVGRDAYCHWLPSLLGGHLVRQHLELAVSEPGGDMAFRGLFFTEAARAPGRVRGGPARDRPVGRGRALARRRDR